MLNLDRRAFLSLTAKSTAAFAAAPFFVTDASAQAVHGGTLTRSGTALDAFVEKYMRLMNAPGMTLALVSRTGPVRIATYGFADPESHERVQPNHLFQIGSVTKSFVALTLLQLKDEGKLDLNRPVLEYLPWLPIRTDFGPVTTHTLLTHSSGLPNPLAIYPADPTYIHEQAYKPGEHFYYCNMGFAILGELIEKLDGVPWTQSVRRRIFAPLDMTATSAVYDTPTKLASPKSYLPFLQDRQFPRSGKFAQLNETMFEDAAGSICSPAADMARYLQALLNRGAAGSKRIASEQSFTAMTTAHIKADEFSPTASYGYGIAVDELDGHKLLRHTGGTASYMTAVMLDLDAGFAAFASINAQLGYRPNPVVQYALRLLRAEAEGKPLPDAPEIADPVVIKDASQYAGTYKLPNGNRTVNIVADNTRLHWREGARDFIIQQSNGGDLFIDDPAFNRFAVVFGRADNKPDAAVVEMAHGADWFVNDRYQGPREFSSPPEWNAFTGMYYNSDPWVGGVRVVLRKGQLWLDGQVPLRPAGNNTFRLGEPEWSPEHVRFYYVNGGKARMIQYGSASLWRVEID